MTSDARRVIIVGCGRVGGMVAEALLEQGDDVTILDTNQEHFRRLREHARLHMVAADGTSVETLRSVNAGGAEVFIALAAADTTNALAAQTAHVLFRVPRVVCRINDPQRRDMYGRLGLRAVSSSRVVADLVLGVMGEEE
ncbi:MAG: NAD-binding protein [Dehalococcoidia bacterium]|nr:NAD-binding protein [Dehalococcoidia bacterium]